MAKQHALVTLLITATLITPVAFTATDPGATTPIHAGGTDVDAPAQLTPEARAQAQELLQALLEVPGFADIIERSFPGGTRGYEDCILDTCADYPGLVDETGDTMTGRLDMQDDLVMHRGTELIFDNGSHLRIEDGSGFDVPELVSLLIFDPNQQEVELGTSGADPFQLVVDKKAALRLLPGTTPSLVAGSTDNTIETSAVGASVLGGQGNTAASYSTVLGGQQNAATGTNALAAGQHAKALHDGTFVWADSQGTDFSSTGPDQLLVRAIGGVGINTDSPAEALDVAGSVKADGFVGSGADLTGIVNLNAADCATGELPKVMAGAWGCAVDIDTTYTAGQGLALEGTTLSLVSCTEDQLLKIGAGTWTCAEDLNNVYGAGEGLELADGTFALTDCADDELLKVQLGTWTCAVDQISDTAYQAGNGLTLDGTTFAVAPCGEGLLLKVNATGDWVCSADLDTDTVYSAGNGLALADTTFGLVPCAADELLKVDAGGTWVCGTDVDTDTVYQAGPGLQLDGTTFGMLPCSAGGILKVNATGAWTCSTDEVASTLSWSALTNVPAGFADDIDDDLLATLACADDELPKFNASAAAWVCGVDVDTDTVYSAGTGLALDGTTFNADLTTLQARISAACAAGEAIRAIAADGTVTCEVDDDTLYSGVDFAVSDQACATGSMATGIDTTGAITCAVDQNTDTLDELTCTDGQLAKVSGTGWACAEDIDTIDPNTDLLAGLTCTADAIVRFNGTTWVCGLDRDTTTTELAWSAITSKPTGFADDIDNDVLAGLSCADGELPKFDGGSSVWTCAEDIDTDTDTLYQAGTGLLLDGTTFNVDTTVVQSRVTSACPAGQAVRAIATDGTVTCEIDDDTLYSGLDFAISGQGCPADHLASGINTSGGLTCALDQDTDTLASLACADGEIAKVSVSSWTCAADADTQTTTLPWSSVTGKPSGFADDIDHDLLGSLSCGAGQLAKWNGTAWDCADDIDTDTDTDTTYAAGDGLSLTGTTFAVNPCADGEVLKFDGTSTQWTCAADETASSVAWSAVTDKPAGFADDVDDDVLAALSCTDGQVAKLSSGSWTCAEDLDTDTDTTYDGSDFALSAQSCPSGELTTGIDGGGALTCAVDQDTTYTGVDFALSDQACTTDTLVAAVSAAGTLVCEAPPSVDPSRGVQSVPRGHTWSNHLADLGTLDGPSSVAVGGNGYPVMAFSSSTGAHLIVCEQEDCSQNVAYQLTHQSDISHNGALAVGPDGLASIVTWDPTFHGLGVNLYTCADPSCDDRFSYLLRDNGRHAVVGFGAHGDPLVVVGGSELELIRCHDRTCSSTQTATSVVLDSLGSESTSLAVSPDGRPVVAYVRGGDLLLAACDDIDCSSATTTTLDAGGVAEMPILAIGADGLPTVAYVDDSSISVARCGSLDCTGEVSLIKLGVGHLSGPAIGFVLDVDGMPLIGYDGSPGGGMHLVKCGTPTCRTGNVTNDLGLDLNTPSIAIGSDGLPVISHMALGPTGNQPGLLQLGNDVGAEHWWQRGVAPTGAASTGLVAGGVGSFELADGGISTADLADGSVTPSKMLINEPLIIGPDEWGDDVIGFGNAGSETLRWDDLDRRFVFSSDLSIRSEDPNDPERIYFGNLDAEYLAWDQVTEGFELTDDLRLDGDVVLGNGGGASAPTLWFDQSQNRFIRDGVSQLDVSTGMNVHGDAEADQLISRGSIHSFGDLFVGDLSTADDDTIYFDDGISAYLQWDESDSRFLTSHELGVPELRVGTDDAFDDDAIYFDSGVKEYLRWDESEDAFDLSSGLAVDGQLSATRMGIGTADPLGDLHVRGAGSTARLVITPSTGTDGNAEIFLAEPYNAAAGIKIVYDGTDDELEIIGNNSGVDTTLVTVERDSGWVGLGTSTPNAHLAIENVGGVDGEPLLVFSENEDAEFVFESGFAGTGSSGNEIVLSTFWGADAMTWKGDGKVGIGTRNPAQPLHVVGDLHMGGGPSASDSNSEAIILDARSDTWFLGAQNTDSASTTDFYIGKASSPDGLFHIENNGNVGIGTNDPTTILSVKQGSATDPIADAWTTYSSIRWKEDVETFEDPIETIEQLRGVQYAWKETGQQDVGLIAEEVATVLPEIVQFEEDGVTPRGVDYARLVGVLIEGIKVQQDELDDQDQEIVALQARLTSLEDVVAQFAATP